MSNYKIPKSEISKVIIRNSKGTDKFLITQKTNDYIYLLYEIVDNKLNKLGQANSPTKLETKFNVWKKVK